MASNSPKLGHGEKTQLIMRLLEQTPELTAQEVALQVGCTKQFVQFIIRCQAVPGYREKIWSRRQESKQKYYSTPQELFRVRSRKKEINQWEKEIQSLSQETARNARQLWTIAQDKLLLSGEYTNKELTVLTGRTYNAVTHRKRRLRKTNE